MKEAESIFVERIISLTTDHVIEEKEYERLFDKWIESGKPCKGNTKYFLEKQRHLVNFIEDTLTLNMTLRAMVRDNK